MALLEALYSPAEIAERVGQRFQALRLLKNISRSSLATKSGVPASNIKRFETTGQVSFVSLVMIAQALGVMGEIDKLLVDVEPQSLDEIMREPRKRGRG